MENNNDKIERYLTDQMDSAENEAFLNDLRNDTALRNEAQMMALMIKEMKENQSKQDAEVIEEIQNNTGLAACKAACNDSSTYINHAAATRPMIIFLRWSLSIAAMFVLIFGAALLWNRQSDADELFKEYYYTYTIDHGPAKGGDDSNVEKELAALFNQVGTEKDISTVIDKLQKIYDSVDSEYEYSLFANDITWYLAMAYLKDGKPEKTKELLKPLVEGSGNKYKAEARKLTERIDAQKLQKNE